MTEVENTLDQQTWMCKRPRWYLAFPLRLLAALSSLRQPMTPFAVRTIYLTFDDGVVGLQETVAALNDLGVPGTFFLTGKAIRKHPQTVCELVRNGHSLGNHTYHHVNLVGLSAEAIAWEIEACDYIALTTAGVSTKPLFRPPYGAVTRQVRETAASLGYQTILWHVNTWDWAAMPAAVIARGIGHGGIVLLHTQARKAIPALYRVVPKLREQGYRFATLSTPETVS